MSNRKIQPETFTPTMGAYSHGYEVDLGASAGRMIFTTGQIALDDKGELVSQDITKQTEFVFQRIETILSHAGATLDDVVKVQIFTTDITEFAAISKVRNVYLAKSEPVSTLVQVGALVHPDCRIEIEAIAVVQV